MDAISKVFVSVLPFINMNRVISEDWLWSAYNKCKLPVRKDTTNSLTNHQQKVADVFYTLSGLSPVAIPNELTDGNTENAESIQQTAEYVCKQLAEEDEFTENDNGDITLSNEDVHVPTSITNALDDDSEDDEDPEDALRILSNIKRYKINPLCK